MSFKNKSKKIINFDSKVTLESKHNYFLKKFKPKEKIEELKIKKTRLKMGLKNIKDINIIIKIKDEIIELEEELNNYDTNYNNSNEIQYYLDNGPLIFDYFNTNITTKDTNKDITKDTTKDITKVKLSIISR